MTESRTKNSARNILSGMILKFFLILMPFIVRTVIIKKIGMEYLGLNSLFTSILQVLSLSELGFSLAVSFCLYKPIELKDTALVCALINFLKKVYYVIGIIILIIGVSLLPFLPSLISGDYPKDINIYLLYLIFLFNSVISYFLFSYYGVILSASQRTDIDNKINLLFSTFMYLSQIIVLLVTKNYYLYIIFLPLSTILMNLFRMIICKKIYPEYIPSGSLPKEERILIKQKIKALIGHKLAYTIVASTDSIFISAFLGLILLAQYQNYFYIITSLMAIVNTLQSAIIASIGNSLAFESKEKNYHDFICLTFLNVWMIGWMSICLICLYQPFIKLWIGEDNLLPMSTVLLLTIYFYSWRFKDMVSVYKDAAGMWTSDFFKPYVIAIINIILDFILVKYMGLNGVIIATILSVPVVSIPWETHCLYNEYFCMKTRFYYIRLLVYTIIIVIIGFLTYYLCSLLPLYDIPSFILRLFICGIVPNIIIILISFRTKEFLWFKNKIKMIIKKQKKESKDV